MNLTRTIVLILLTFSSVSSFGQTNFIRGYYVTLENDTVHGLIEKRSEVRNNRICVFRADAKAKPVAFLPSEIRAFVLDNTEIYESHPLNSKSATRASGFFNMVLKGKLSLLTYQSRYFVKTPGNAVIEIGKRRIREINQVSGINQDRLDYSGMGTLKALMGDCEQSYNFNLEKEYEEQQPDYRKIFISYHNCINAHFFLPKPVRLNRQADVGITAGAGIYNLEIGSAPDASFKTSNSAFIGVFTSVFLPQLPDRMRIVMSGEYGQAKNYAFYTRNGINNDLFLDYSFIRVPLLLRYGGNRFFIDAGVQGKFLLNPKMQWRREVPLDNTIVTSNVEVGPPASFSGGWVVGAGYRITIGNKDIFASARYSVLSSKGNHTPRFTYMEFTLSSPLRL